MGRFGILLLFAAAVAPVPASAQTGEQGSFCVHDFAAGLSCSGTEVGVEALELVSVSDPCGPDATAQVVVDLVLATDVGSRYDIGMIVALNGGSAESGGVCYHDYLAPPLSTSPTYGDYNGNTVPDLRNGPWVDLEPFAQPEDDCGDMHGNTEAIKTLKASGVSLQLSCVDTNHDGTVDVSVCASWRNGTMGACQGLSDAIPEASSRCSCTRLEVLPEPGTALALACGAAVLALAGRTRRE